MKIAKADLVPTTANLLDAYAGFAELADACEQFCEKVNARVHRETAAVPAERLSGGAAAPARAAGRAATRSRWARSGWSTTTRRSGSARCATPPRPGMSGRRCGAGSSATSWSSSARTSDRAGRDRPAPAVHAGQPAHPRRALPAPSRREPAPPAEDPATHARRRSRSWPWATGAHDWLVEAGAVGAQRVRAKMARAVELAAVVGADAVDDALGLAAIAGRFADDDLVSILDHRAGAGAPVDVVRADETHSVQPGTSGWEGLGR